MTPSGQLEVWFPTPLFYLPFGTAVTIQDVVKGLTGCTIVSRAFPCLSRFRRWPKPCSEHFFICHIPEHWPPNDRFDTPVGGPMRFQWTLDLAISQ
jgi:hypothetical protein